jgi:hypothetical protein
MRGKTRLPFTKASSPETKIKDIAVIQASTKLHGLKEKDFPLKQKFDRLEPILDAGEKNTLILCKLLYCLDYKREMFLHLGVIVESTLNKVISTYQVNNWRTPSAFIDAANQAIQFNKFRKEKALSGKADDISRFNLFNHLDTSDQIKHKIQSFRFLRNYGGHSKSVNEFLDLVIDSQPDCDDEIDEAFKLINSIHIAHRILLTNAPPVI